MTDRFESALRLALEAHSGQIRKGTHNAAGLAVPYITHPVAVSALVVRYGGDEDQAIAGLLHDVLEDGEAGRDWAGEIRQEFGEHVLALVQACTDGTPDETGAKAPWQDRKEAYIAHLTEAPPDALLVSACDKLHNLQSILLDLTEIGDAVFSRFKAGKEGTLWYYGRLVDAFAGRVAEPLDAALRRDLEAILRRSA